jgi:hypothetical protein
MAGKKTSKTAIHSGSSENDDPNQDGAPPSEADAAKERVKLLRELVSERKKVDASKKDLLKKIRENETNVTKFLTVIAARDKTISTKDVQIAEQKALVETNRVRLSSKDETFKAQRKTLSTEHDASTVLLQGQLDLKKKEAAFERTKASSVGRELCIANDKVKKLQVDLEKTRRFYDDIDRQLRDNKSDVTKLKKELTTSKKRVSDQMEKQLAHKERMKDKEIERERICAKKSKDNNRTKLLAEERKHANVMVRTEQRYGIAESANLKKHTLKTRTDTEKTDTAVARAAQAAIQVQMSQNSGHFPNPRGVDLERVSPSAKLCCLLLVLILQLTTLIY